MAPGYVFHDWHRLPLTGKESGVVNCGLTLCWNDQKKHQNLLKRGCKTEADWPLCIGPRSRTDRAGDASSTTVMEAGHVHSCIPALT